MTDSSSVVRVAISEALPTEFRPVRTVMTWVTGTHSLSTISGIPRIRTLSLAFSGGWCGHRNRGYLPGVVIGRMLPDGDGLHPSVIQERLGHATIAETDNYGHLFADASELGRDALDMMFASADACADARPRTIVSVQS